MKHLKPIIIVFLMSSLGLTAQNKDTKEADHHFEKFEFIDAIKGYTKLVENNKADTYIYSQLAEANFNIYNTVEAEKWYAKALETSQGANVMFKYAEMLKANGKYDLFNSWMQKFADANPTDDRAIAFKANPDYISRILEREKEFEIKTLSFNSEGSDFGGTVKDGILYFSSARNNARRTYGWNEEPFLDIYQITVSTDESMLEAELVEGVINTKYHEGLVSFSPDGNTMYFTRESFYKDIYEKNKENKTKASVIHLFLAKKDGTKWNLVEALPFNADNYSVKNPSVSKDGKTLYFASDMEGGLGKFDIYKATIHEDGSFGNAENLGDKINTKEQEMFPFISDNGTLYFSSTGHLGLGSLDVFYVAESGEVVNAGVPINSNSDDFAFTIQDEIGEGYVSSNRSGGRGNDDIYGIRRLEPCNRMLTTTVVDDETNNPIAGARVTIKDGNGQAVSSQTADKNGQVAYTVSCEKSLEILGTMPGYESNIIMFSGSDGKEASLQLNLKPIDKIIVEDRVALNPIPFDFDNSEITPQGAFELDKLVAVMNKYPDMVILVESHTDSRGAAQYNEQLSDRRAKSTVHYVISKGIDAGRIRGVGKGESNPKLECGLKCTEEEHQTNRRSEFIIVSGGPTQN